jgi:hypothetical protein
MSKENNFIVFLSIVLLLACKQKESPDFYFTNSQLKYKFHDVSSSNYHPKIGDFLALHAQLKDANDSILYESNTYNTFDLFYMDSLKMNSLFFDGFSHLVVGDSVSFYLTLDQFYIDYLNTEIPLQLTKEDVEFNFRIKDVFQNKNDFMLKFLSEEQMVTHTILDEWRGSKTPIFNYGLINWIHLNEIGDSLIKVNDEVDVFYSCYLNNDILIYSSDSLNPDNFIVGLEGQMIEGFDFLLQNLHYGDHVIAIIPSLLAFNEKGGVNGKVPPNTPLLIDLKIVSERD